MAKKSKVVETAGRISAVSRATGASAFTMHTQLPPDHPFYALVGRVASEWAQLEHILDSVIYILVNSGRKAALPANILACVTSQLMGVGPRCKAILLLAQHRGLGEREILKPFRSLLNKSYKPADDRARFVHDPWFIEVSSKVPAQFRAMPYSDPTYGYKEVSEDDANRVIDKIRELQDRALKLKDSVTNALRASE